jgi:MFS transporter, DHA2 family, multidrug resistance protein
LCLTLMGAGLGTAMTPGLDAIMSAMPQGEFGAGSAVASTFRQVGAAIGVALLGDIYLNRYVAKLHLPPGLPAPVVHIARQSVGAANAVAAKLPAPLAGQVRGQAHAAFMTGLDWALLLAAGVALLAAGLVAAFLPGRKPAAQAPQPALPEAGRDHPGPA